MRSSTIVSVVVTFIAIGIVQSLVVRDNYQRRRFHDDSDNDMQYDLFLRRIEQVLDEDNSENLDTMEERAEFDTVPSKTYGGTGGPPFTDANVLSSSKINVPQKIAMNQASNDGITVSIGAIQITYEALDETVVKAPKHGELTSGATSKKECKTFELKPDEYIVKVNGGTDKYVNWLQFTTNTDRKSEVCGSKVGTSFTAEQKGYVLSFISGAAGRVLDQIQFHWIKLPAPTTTTTTTTKPTTTTPSCRSGGVYRPLSRRTFDTRARSNVQFSRRNNFIASCNTPSLQGYTIVTQCRKVSGQTIDASFDINQLVNNNDGELKVNCNRRRRRALDSLSYFDDEDDMEFQRRASIQNTCDNIRLDGQTLTASCSDAQGCFYTSTINVNQYISNIDGALQLDCQGK